MYEWKGFPFPEKGWRYEPETMAKLDDEGRIWYPTKDDGEFDLTKRPRLKRYLEEGEGGGVIKTVLQDEHLSDKFPGSGTARLPDPKAASPA